MYLLLIIWTAALAETENLKGDNITSKEQTATEVSSMELDFEPCKCVPHYLCRGEYAHIFDRNAPSCTASVEVCCFELLDPPTKPKPGPAKEGCGCSNPRGVKAPGVQIPGDGRMVEFGEYPWVVALLNSENNEYVGAGALIHRQVVMTVAHIAAKVKAMKIRAGEWDTQTTEELFEHQERDVDEIYIHKEYNKKRLLNDVALLRLSEPLELTEHINAICLPEQAEDFGSYRSCVTNGWSKDSFGKEGRFAVILRKLEIDMVAHGRCQTLLRNTRLGNSFKLGASFVCAGGDMAKNSCTADGGAPLACPAGNNRYTLAGLMAWGIGCGENGVPTVFANVAAFRSWVDEKMVQWNFESMSYQNTNNK